MALSKEFSRLCGKLSCFTLAMTSLSFLPGGYHKNGTLNLVFSAPIYIRQILRKKHGKQANRHLISVKRSFCLQGSKKSTISVGANKCRIYNLLLKMHKKASLNASRLVVYLQNQIGWFTLDLLQAFSGSLCASVFALLLGPIYWTELSLLSGCSPVPELVRKPQIKNTSQFTPLQSHSSCGTLAKLELSLSQWILIRFMSRWWTLFFYITVGVGWVPCEWQLDESWTH